MNDIYLNKDITCLVNDEQTINILKSNEKSKIRDVWMLKRQDLKKMGLTDTKINDIIIKLQLNGLDINSKVYNKI